MSTDISELVDRLRRHYDDACFACGRDNPMGLHLDGFQLSNGEVSARFDPRPEYRGTPSVLHGGVAATALDEILVWAGILSHRVMSVTALLQLKFRKPASTTGSLEVRGRIDERRGRRLLASGEMLLDGAVTAEAEGLLLVTQPLEELLRHG